MDDIGQKLFFVNMNSDSFYGKIAIFEAKIDIYDAKIAIFDTKN